MKNKFGWEIKKLSEVSKIFNGGTPTTSVSEFWNGSNLWITPKDMGKLTTKFVGDTERKITEAGLKNSSARMLPINSVIISSRAPIGHLAINTKPICTNQGCKGLIPNKSIDTYFLYYFLRSSVKLLNDLGTGATFKEISAAKLSNVKLALPPLPIQHQIVSELDALSEIISKKKQQLEELDKLSQATFYDIFGDPVTNEKGWVFENLGSLCTIVRGGSPRPIEKFLGGDVPWIKIGDATKGNDIYLYSTKEHIIREGVTKSRLIPKGSMIFANCGVSLGFARIITFEGCIHDGWLAFHNISERLNEIFLLKHMNFQTDYFRKLAPEGTQPNLNTGIMNKTKVIVPPISLQELFASKIKSIESQKSLITQSIAEVQQLFDYTMDKYFN